MRKLLFSLFFFSLVNAGWAVNLADATIVIGSNDNLWTHKWADVIASDIQRVCGHSPEVEYSMKKGPNLVLGVAGESKFINFPEAQSLKGEWERFCIKTDGKNVYVAGSDPRGLAYGIFHISKKIGVNPWYWWADIPVKKKKTIEFNENFTSKSPSVKYRGIFINDEDWGLKTWAADNFEKELGDIGPKTYDKVCELILRLKGNMLAPAMHDCTGAFYSHPKSQEVAASWGIMITTSHCEPLLFNNAAKSEWDKEKDGEWNYLTNKDVIYKKLDDRIRETAGYDNIYTMGMRGLHDEAMKGSTDPKVRARTLETVFSDQREILTKHKKKPVTDIPQIFVPYKETLDIYNAGLEVPEDITIVWPDDNYGYMKKVSNESEKNRKGGSGVYYHLSYLGTPHDYLWICTTPPVLMYEELMKAYEAGADRYWLLNVGDIKPMELGMQTFFDLAWNVGDFSFESINQHQAKWLSGLFGKKYQHALQGILDEYYRLAWQRKPEYMGYEIQWDAQEYKFPHDSDFSFQDGSAQERLLKYSMIDEQCQKIIEKLQPEEKIAFFQLLGFSVKAAFLMNQKFLYAQQNHETGSVEAGQKAKKAFDDINELMNEYNSMNGGKWNQMMSQVPPGYVSQYQIMPEIVSQPTDKFKLSQNQKYIQYQNHIDLKTLTLTEPFELIHGIGTDWVTLQLGKPFDKVGNPADINAQRIDIPIKINNEADSLFIAISTVPMWPVDEKRSNAFGVSVDWEKPVVCENKIVEWSFDWKLQVLENRKDYLLAFPLDKNRSQHTISLIIGDPGQLIQKITYQ